jgi:phage tail sheath gpL-like
MKLTRLTAVRKRGVIQITGQFRGASGYRVRVRLADVPDDGSLPETIDKLLKKDLTVKEARAIGGM